MDESLERIDYEEVLLRLTACAYRLFGVFRRPGVEPVLRGGEGGESPEDLALAVLLRFLDPEDRTLRWDTAKGGEPTARGLLALLRRVLQRDFLDLKRKGRYRRCDYLATVGPSDGGGGQDLTLDDFASTLEPPDLAAIRNQHRERMVRYFEPWPDLAEIVALQVEVDDSYKLTNQELAMALDTTVSDIQNRKKRIQRHSMKARLFTFGARAESQAGPVE